VKNCSKLCNRSTARDSQDQLLVVIFSALVSLVRISDANVSYGAKGATVDIQGGTGGANVEVTVEVDLTEME
jgi:hypothetical protein